MYAATSTPVRSAAPRIGEWLSEAFNLFGQQWQVWVVQGIVYLLISAIPVVVALLFSMGALTAAFAGVSSTSGTSGAASDGAAAGLFAAIFAFYGALLGGSCVSGLISLFFFAGMLRTASKQLRGDTITVGDLFSGGDAYFSLLGAYVIVYLGVMLGVNVLVLPGLLLAALWMFVHPLIVEKRLGVFAALGASYEATKGHIWMYLLWVLLIGLIASAGSFLVCGSIATIPISLLMLMVSYRDVFGLPGAVGPLQLEGVPGTAPLADYGPAGPPMAALTCPGCSRAVAAGAVVCPFCSTPLAPPPAFPPAEWTEAGRAPEEKRRAPEIERPSREGGSTGPE